MPIPVVITAFADRDLHLRVQDAAGKLFLKRAAGLEKGAATPGRTNIGKVTLAQVREIAEQKMKDLNANGIDAAISMVKGSALSMGIEVVGRAMAKQGKRLRDLRAKIDPEKGLSAR